MQKSLERIQSLLEQPNSKPDEALVLLTSMARGEEPPWQVLHYIGIAYILKKELDAALTWLLKASKAGADEAMTNHFISVCYLEKGKHEKAAEYERKALDRRSTFDGWMHLGAIYRAQAKLKEALACYKKAADIEPENTKITKSIAGIYSDNGRLGKAIGLFETTINEEDEQGNIEAYFAIAQLLKKKQRFRQAESYLNKILRKKPDDKLTKVLLSGLKRETGNYKRAIELCEELLEETPEGKFRLNYAICLQEIGEFEKAERNYLRVLEEHPSFYQSLSNYLMCIHYNPAQNKDDIFQAHKLWDRHFAPEKQPVRPSPDNKKATKPLRIGFISGGLQKHPVGWMITEALEYLPNEFKIYCYSTENTYDFLTNRISEAADTWRSVVGYGDEVIADMIRDDEIDILIELSGHAAGNRLRTIAEEPAPVIAKWVGGLFNTTGLKAIDYLITDRFESPEGEEPYYTEKLVRMPEDYICYHPPFYAGSVQPLPARQNGYITFGCFNNPAKVNDEILHQWAKIMNGLPGSRLLLKSKQYDVETLRNRIIQKLDDEGIAEDRITFKGQSNHKDHLSYYNKVDIALDPWPYSGGLTTCEALWMGVPVVTKPGPTFAGKHSKTHLINAGFPDWVVDSWDEYIEKTLALAGDIEQLADLRSTMREQVADSPLCDGPRFAAHFGKALRAMWKQRVKGYEENIGEWQDHIQVEPLSGQEIATITGTSKIDKEALNSNPSNMTQANDIDQNAANGTIDDSKQENFIIPEQQNGGHGFNKNGKKGQEHSPMNVEQQDSFRVETVDDITICTPADLEVLTSYVLLEQEQWFEPELHFVREFLQPGMHAVDIGAGFGAYTLPMAKTVTNEGHVYGFEPGFLAKRHLQMSMLENAMENIELSSKAVSDGAGPGKLHQAKIPELNKLATDNGMDVSITTLDVWWEFALKPKVDFIKLDVNGDEGNVLVGAEKLIADESPVILVAIGESNTDEKEAAIEKLQAYNYQLYEYVAGLELLTEHDPQDYDAYLMNLIAIPNNRVQEFKDHGWIYNDQVEVKPPEAIQWKETLRSQPWTASLMNNWEQKTDEKNESYLEALELLCVAEYIHVNGEEHRTNRSKKTKLILEAVQQLVAIYNRGDKAVEVAFMLARGLHMIGQRSQAVEVLKKLMDDNNFANQDIELARPFFLPLQEQDHTDIETNLKNWLTVRMVEAWISLKNPTTYFSGEQAVNLVELLENNYENTVENKKKNILLNKLHGQENNIKFNRETRFNNWFWGIFNEAQHQEEDLSRKKDDADYSPGIEYPSEIIGVELNHNPSTEKDSITVYIPKKEVFRLENIFKHDEYALPDGLTIQDDGVIVDIGANVGAFALYAVNWNKKAAIYCFEPNPKLVPLLESNTESIENLNKKFVALGDHDGELNLYQHPINTGQSSTAHAIKGAEVVKVTIEHAGKALRQKKIQKIDVLKIDTEGAEVEILNGLRNFLPYTKVVMAEYHSEDDRRKIDKLLNGFQLYSAQVQKLWGVGTVKYINRELLK